MWLWAQVLTSPVGRIKALIAIVAMGVVIEFLQGWSGLRTFDAADMVANAAGATSGWMAARVQATLTRKYFSSGA
jgi:VanZ family protein